MSSSHHLQTLHGVLLLNKAVGLSSNQALSKIKKSLRVRKAGFAGTLDPFAEGLLPLVFGEATKFVHYATDADKEYRLTIRFGQQTDSDDCTGSIICEKPAPNLQALDWSEILQHFSGVQMQTPPGYSALKVNGQRAYELMRQGIKPQLKAREIKIDDIELLSIKEDSICLRVACSKGSYMRSLARDLGHYLNTVAHASALSRLRVGRFSLANAYTSEQIEKIHPDMERLILPVQRLVEHLPAIDVPREKERYFLNGNDILIDKIVDNGVYRAYVRGVFVGSAKSINNRLHPIRLIRKEFLDEKNI